MKKKLKNIKVNEIHELIIGLTKNSIKKTVNTEVISIKILFKCK